MVCQIRLPSSLVRARFRSSGFRAPEVRADGKHANLGGPVAASKCMYLLALAASAVAVRHLQGQAPAGALHPRRLQTCHRWRIPAYGTRLPHAQTAPAAQQVHKHTRWLHLLLWAPLLCKLQNATAKRPPAHPLAVHHPLLCTSGSPDAVIHDALEQRKLGQRKEALLWPTALPARATSSCPQKAAALLLP